jgi:hypothetical protein
MNTNGSSRNALNREAMARNATRLVGILVWRGGKWYVQRVYLSRLPPARKVVLVGAGGVAATGAAAALTRRAVRARRVRTAP